MANKLKIYACSGIGDNAGADYDYWFDNNNIFNQTQAVNGLLALIEADYLELQHGVKDSRAIELLNRIDLYSVCLYFAQEYSGNTQALERAGNVVGWMYDNGTFYFKSLNNTERDAHLDRLFYQADELFKDEKYDKIKKSVFWSWWKQYVLDVDKVGISYSDKERLKEYLSKALKKNGVGSFDEAMNDEILGEKFKQSENYFLYTFFTKDQLRKLPYVFTKKFVEQTAVYNYCKSLYIGVYGNEASMRAGIRNEIEKSYGMPVEDVCKYIASGKIKPGVRGVGGLLAILGAIAAVLSALAPIVVPIIQAIFNYKKSVEIAEQHSLDNEIIENGCPKGEDINGIDFGNSSSSNWLLAAGASLIGLLLISKRKKK